DGLVAMVSGLVRDRHVGLRSGGGEMKRAAAPSPIVVASPRARAAAPSTLCPAARAFVRARNTKPIPIAAAASVTIHSATQGAAPRAMREAALARDSTSPVTPKTATAISIGPSVAPR